MAADFGDKGRSLLPADQARRCWCREPNTTGLCAYPEGECPRELRDGVIHIATRRAFELIPETTIAAYIASKEEA